MSEHIVRQTRQKDAIRDALNGCDEFISAQELHRKLEDRGEHIGLATVYRQLNALAEAGRADTVRLDGRRVTFDPCTGTNSATSASADMRKRTLWTLASSII